MKYLLMASLLIIFTPACSRTNNNDIAAQQQEMRLQKIEFDISCLMGSFLHSDPTVSDSPGVRQANVPGAVLSAQRGNEYAREWINNNTTNSAASDKIYYYYAISPFSSVDEINSALKQVNGMIERAVNDNSLYSWIAAIYARNEDYDNARKYQLMCLSSLRRDSPRQKEILQMYENKQPYIRYAW